MAMPSSFHPEHLAQMEYRLPPYLRGALQVGNLKPGDLVVFQDSSYHTLSWPLGHIVSTSPGKD